MNYLVNTLIDIFTALLTPTIAILGAYIAIQQYRLAKEKHRIEIYDRRLRIYNTTIELLRSVERNATIGEEAYYEFDKGIAEAEFLFGKEVVALLEDISHVGFSILLVKSEEGYEERPTKLTRANLRHADLINEFLAFHSITRNVFAPYLRLPISPVKNPGSYKQRFSDILPKDELNEDEDIPF